MGWLGEETRRDRIVIATIKSWNIAKAREFALRFQETLEVSIITDKRELTYARLAESKPRLVFFPHWSWVIPEEIHRNFECIVFHISDLPFGRGGSPLQNLIQRKIYQTNISALRVESALDAGKIYLKEPLDLSTGSAEEILRCAAEKVFFKMIPTIIQNKPVPTEQQGEVTFFTRRTPEQSDLNSAVLLSLQDFYDFVRMLDGEGYPKAFLRLGRILLEFSKVSMDGGRVSGTFEATYSNE